ncbi:hypothetical protein ACFSTC_28605 [Nonomuraea ferruginea]
MPVVLWLGDQAVTLIDPPPSRQFAAILALTVRLTDATGLDGHAEAGERVTVRIELAATGS